MHFNQQSYVKKLLKTFQLSDAPAPRTLMEAGQQFTVPTQDSEKLSPEEITTYQQLVGFLMYLMTQTRPDIAVSVSILSRAMAAPARRHLTAVTRVFLYLKGTSNRGIMIKRPESFQLNDSYDLLPHLSLLGYVDSEYAGILVT